MELVKLIGGFAWVIGLVLFFAVDPTAGMVVLAVAILATLWSRAKDRERKHAELVHASQKAAPAPAPQPARLSTAERLANLDALRQTGTISSDEHAAKRQAILDDL